MNKTNPQRYLLRNKLHQEIGYCLENEIITKIREGKVTGEDEALQDGSNTWKRLSSWPAFYDVLISQALHLIPSFENETANESPDNSLKDSPNSPRDIHTFGSEIESNSSREAGEPKLHLDSTQQLEAEPDSLVPQSEIDALFVSNSRPKPNPLAELSQPLEELQPILEKGISEKDPPRTGLKKNKRVFLWAGVLLLLLFLFQSGDSPSDLVDSASVKEAAAPTETIPESEDQFIFFTQSAEQALQMDSPYGYREAALAFQKALDINPKIISLYEGVSMALARSLEEEPTKEETLLALKKYVAAGRAIEPQRTVFYRAEAIAERALGNTKKAQELLDAAVETDSLNPENLLLQAEWFITENKYSEAKKILESVLSWSPQSVKASYLLAETYYHLGDLDRAQELAQKILQINPTHTASYFLMGNLFAKKNDLKAAKALMSLAAKFAQLGPKQIAGQALWRMGNLVDLGPNLDEAEPYYLLAAYFSKEFKDAAKEKTKSPATPETLERAKKEVLANPAYFERLGSEAVQEKNFERAEGLYLAATWLYPNISKLWQRLGEVRESLARTREEFRWAVSTYLTALKVDPDNVETLIRLGLLETEQSNLNRAFEFLQRAAILALEEDPAVHLALGKHLFARKDYKAAIEQLRLARQKNPSNPEISYYQGLLYKLFAPENPKSAMRHFEEAYSKDPSNYDALAEWLKLKVVTFEKMFAVKFMRNMVAADPKNPKLLWAFGEIYSANKEFIKAIQYYQRALDLGRTDSKSRLSLARALASVGRLDEAVSEYKLASDLDAKNGEGYFLAAEILYQLGKSPAAKDLLLGLLKVIPSYPGARRLLAMNHQKLGEKDQAISEMTKEVVANPMNYQFLLELADLLFINDRPADAEKELAKITNLPLETTVRDSRSPSGFRKEPTGLKGYRTRGLLLLSRLYRNTNRNEAAEGAVQSGLKIDPENLDLKLERAYVYKSLGRIREAAIDFSDFLNKNPNAREAAEARQELKKIEIEEQ